MWTSSDARQLIYYNEEHCQCGTSVHEDFKARMRLVYFIGQIKVNMTEACETWRRVMWDELYTVGMFDDIRFIAT